MKFRNVTREQLDKALEACSLLEYDGNITWNRGPDQKGNAFIATIRAKDSRKAGSRRTWQGRRSVGASWHAHRDFFRFIYRLAPQAIIDTGLYGAVRYTSAEQFEETHPATYHVNVGSRMQPVALGDLSVEAT